MSLLHGSGSAFGLSVRRCLAVVRLMIGPTTGSCGDLIAEDWKRRPMVPGRGKKKASPDRSGEAFLKGDYSAWMFTALLRPRLSC